MQMATGTGLAGIGLCHECDAHAKAIRHFLETLLKHGVAIRHRQSVGIPDVQFVLTLSPFPFEHSTGTPDCVRWRRIAPFNLSSRVPCST